MLRISATLLALCASLAFSAFLVKEPGEKPVFVPPTPQRSGDPVAGLSYLTTGEYVRGGIPYDFFRMGLGAPKKTYLQREGLNGTLSHDFTVVKARNGENLVAPNCMQCHAQVVDNNLFIGLGNTFIDFSNSPALNPQALAMLEGILKKNAPAKYEAAKPFIEVTKTIGPLLKTEVRGVNAADRLAAVLVAHRDPVTFKWNPKPLMEIPETVIPTDVPAWWLLKKKNALFYNGLGRGDFGRFLMASNLLTVNDTSESREVDNHISDVLAYIRDLRPPRYPLRVDDALAATGKAIFVKNCSKCHGKYGEEDEFPNLLIPASIIKTDSMLYKSNYQNPQFINWFNSSWFAMGDHPARLEPFNGYMAPPLDGIWITAPYLHNGSVPTIEGVLNSRMRPRYWSRNFDKPTYNYFQLSWQFQVHDQPGGKDVYNTDIPGYGNYGHYFGDKLSDEERQAVIEYLKTL